MNMETNEHRNNGSTLFIDVSVYPGSDFAAVAHDMCSLAFRLGVSVWAKFNEKRVLARPNDIPNLLISDYYASIAEMRDTVSAKR